MARGEAGLLNTAAGNAASNAQSLYASASSGTNKIIANPGPTPVQTNQMINAATAPAANTNAAAATRLGQRAVAGANSAGLVAGSRALARQGGQQVSQAALGAQTDATKMSEDELTKALQIQGNLYGSSASSEGSLYSSAQKAAQAQQFKWGIGVGPQGVSANVSG